MRIARAAGRARLTTRPGITSGEAFGPGVHTVDEGTQVYIPDRLTAAAPLVVSLHGAGGAAHHGIDTLRAEADRRGFVIVSPKSAGGTWDIIESDFGRDVRAIDEALRQTMKRVSVDPDHVAISGFSDGASYALTLGIANGDLFRHILAYSPGFSAAPSQEGKPPIFISHGTHDQILPIDRCSRVLVPRLRRAGYAVEYREFEGPHTVPAEIKHESITWWLGANP
jgi:phospholipase/carboxylesterase